MAIIQSTNNRRRVSKLQIGLFIAVGILALLTEIVALRAYFTSGSASKSVEDQSFVTTGLANIQREALLLYLETEKVLRDPGLNRDGVVLRRALFVNQLNLLTAQVRDNIELTIKLDRIASIFAEYDTAMQPLSGVAGPASAAVATEVESVLSALELEVKSLYDDEEQTFFITLSGTLRSNQALQMVLSALVLASGAILAVSLQRSVGALREEMSERDKVEAHLLEANEQIVRSEKLAAIGQLAGGIAHDIRNPLGAIKNATFLLNRAMETDDNLNSNAKIRRNLDTIDAQIDRAERTIGDLMDYSRAQNLQVGPADLNDLVRDCLTDLRGTDGIDIVQDYDAEIPAILCDKDQIHRVLVNLAVNARDAMPNGGRLTASTRVENGFTKIAICDNGVGINDSDLDKIFEPMFTTKAGGTGFGLAVCKEIVERHGGTIDVTPGNNGAKGTIFTVNLPIPV